MVRWGSADKVATRVEVVVAKGDGHEDDGDEVVSMGVVILRRRVVIVGFGGGWCRSGVQRWAAYGGALEGEPSETRWTLAGIAGAAPENLGEGECQVHMYLRGSGKAAEMKHDAAISTMMGAFGTSNE
ncbi:hypothetical protein Tco_1090970 [Tanacetum coccineum]|uniref:Uncharacterized protein n=1 Tax=Tanacetum coccineum TaxID=301880 RepID=A0ABQ5I822_9ASTR